MKEQQKVSQKQKQPNRHIRSLQSTDNYPNNKVKSTSTNIFTFVPVNLFRQLTQTANIYFIIVAIFQCIKVISVTNGKPTVLIPLSIVILIVMIKDAIQQIQRYKKDAKQNSNPAQVYNSQDQQWENKCWEDIEVGDVIRLVEDKVIPCDALIIKTQVKDKCYVETKSLDGQTDLKIKKGFTNHIKFKNLSQNVKKNMFKQSIEIQYSSPNQFLHEFNGYVVYNNQNISVSIDNLLLRSCILKNVQEAICICLYTGKDTKVAINSHPFQAKVSKLVGQVRKMIVQIFIWQFSIALATALLNTLIESSYPALMGYIPSSRFWILTWSWWLMMTYFVPISLIVTMEMVKMFQGSIIEKDQRGYSQAYKCHITVNNTSVNQNLGQIKYILSDKTGTLTKNQMSFKKLYFNGKSYGQTMSEQQNKYLESYTSSISNVGLYSKELEMQLSKPEFQNYLRVLYLAQEVMVDDKKQNGKITYSSGSPDQIAFINFTKLYGRQLIEENDTIIKIAHTKKGNQIVKYQKLVSISFNSDRKRMSKIVRHPDGKYQILTKGADQIVVKLLRSSDRIKAQQADNNAVKQFSSSGLRVLMLAKKWLTQNEFKKWNSQYQRASAQIQGRNEALQKCYNQIQNNLEFVGITAIEDKLQDQVVQTITMLKQVGIQFFILTGDKKSTAINIGRSCGIIGKNTKVQPIPQYSQDNKQQYYKQLSNLKKTQSGDVVYTLDASKPIPPDLPLHQTICYRCIPKQKEDYVKFVKQKSQQLTIAIGDGANDVDMITQANVGIAVRGKQGSAATVVSDFVIGQFKFLSFLTLYYGREWYRKNSQLVAYNFFKNWFHVSSIVVYGAYSYFSGVLIFDIYMYQLFNLVFAGLPIVAYALCDYQYNAKQSLDIKYKQIYSPGFTNEEFNQTVYFVTIGRGFVYGFLALIFIFFILEDNVLDYQGRTGYLAQSGSVLYFDIILIINLRILILSKGFSPFLLFSVFGCIGSYWVVYRILTTTADTQMELSFKQQLKTWNIFFVHLIMIAVLILTEFGYRKYKWYDHESKRDPMPLIAEFWRRQSLVQKLIQENRQRNHIQN